ncbi:MAG: lipopolysaccharide export system permease protein, partial [Vicingaceae bacterium]
MSPFVATFFISIFVLLMQFLWKYIDDLVGKGIEFSVFAKLLIYVAASLVPMALPLSILLSSLMTFGNLGENYELVAFKSAGISLKRILRPLSFVIFILSIVAFLFSNYWLPVANLKSKSLLYDIKQQKPTMDIQPGMFSNELEDYTIRVQNKKEIDGVEHLYDVIIYDHSDGPGNRNVTTAEEGIMSNSADQRYLQMTLLNGVTYEEEKN